MSGTEPAPGLAEARAMLNRLAARSENADLVAKRAHVRLILAELDRLTRSARERGASVLDPFAAASQLQVIDETGREVVASDDAIYPAGHLTWGHMRAAFRVRHPDLCAKNEGEAHEQEG
jgi:hypothetical protein